MFLFHWCLNAIRCRREWTLETTPLSPTKYNGLPPSFDSTLQRQLVDDIPTSSYDVTIASQSLLDDENAAVQHPTFYQDRRTCLGQENSTAPSTCHSESRDIKTASYFRPDDLDEQTTSSTLSADDVPANGMNVWCECETAATVNENTSQLPYSFHVSNESVPSLTTFRMPSSPYFQAHIYPQMQQGVHSLDKKSFPSFVVNSDLTCHTRSADDIGSSNKNSLRSADVYASDMSHRNVSSFPVDTFQDPLVTVAMLLVNSAVKTAVRILDTDATLTSGSNPVDEIVLSPVSNTSNSLQPLPSSDESTNDPVEVAASKLVNQVLLEIERKYTSSAFACVETLPSETSITAAVCSAASHPSSSPSSSCESDSKLTADNDVESCVVADADSVLMPAAAEDYLSESSATVCFSVDESEVLTEQECDVGALNCNHNSAYAVKDDFESTTSLSSGRLAFVSEGWSTVSSPFTDAYSPDNISEVMYIDNFNVEELKVDSHMRARDELKPHDYPLHIDDDTQTRMLCSAERNLDLSGNTNTDDATNASILYGVSDDDSFLDVHTPLEHYASENTAAETWNSCQSNYRPEDYFFHRYVIPVDQLEAGDLAAQSDRDEQRTKMQLDLKADERKYASDIDADIEAVAAFCRAMFTPVESEIHDDDDNILPYDIVGSPETPDTEGQYRLGRPAGVRRCISLRTSPGTPHKKKSVRFADALGLDLEYVRQIQTGDDSLLAFATNEDAGCSRRPLLAEASAAWSRSRWPVRRYLCACFQEPGSHPDFMDRVLRSRVVLETCEADDRALRITGVIRVANVAYHKTVAARVTTDGWATQTDVTAEYVPRSNDGTTDRFSFQIVLPHGATDVGRRVEFAVYFIAFFDFDCRSETYWDNNFGVNYCFECYGYDDSENSTLDTDNDDDPFSAWFSYT